MLPSLRRWILAVAAAVLTVAGVCGAVGRAATVVLANHAGAKVHFTIVPPGGKPEPRNIAAGDVLSLPAEGELGIVFESEGLPRRYLVPANSIQYFVRREGRLDLTQLALPAVEQGAWPPAAPKPPGVAAGPAKSPGIVGNTVTIPVMILVDQHERAVRQVWEKRLRDRLQEASAVIERCCRVRFEVVAVDTWRSDDASIEFPQALSDFERRVRPAPARLAIGFSSFAKLPAGPAPVTATRGPLHSHILVREGADRAGQLDLLRILIHELGHFLGAVHSADEDSVMRPLLHDPRVNARDFRLGFDPLNTLAINIVVDDLRSQPMHALADARPETKARLRGIYKVLGELLPNDRLAQNYVTLLNPPNRPPIAAAAPRAQRRERSFWALFHDGTYVAAAKFGNRGWWSDDAMLGGHRLFGTGNPVRMLRDTTLSRSLKAAHVVLANGDVLPGRVVKFLPPSPDNGLPARLLISLDFPLVTADPHGLEVRADRVLRLAAAPDRRIDGEPGTLVSTDGARVIATALHWTEQGVQVLTKDGIVTKAFAEIADLRVPGVDVLDAVLDDGRYPPLGSDAIVARLETVDGAVMTYHREMTLVAGPPASQSRRVIRTMPSLHLQPSWALDAILVPTDSIWRQSFRAASEVPLSLLPATVLKQRAGIQQWPWRRNQNVEGDPLWSGHITVDLGLGMHPYSEIAFDLPPSAQEFTTLVGLDRSVGRGACAQCKIYGDQVSGEPLFSSGFLRGGEEPVPVGSLRLAGTKRLVLVTEFGDENRHSGADPFDIGAHVDWLMPFVSFEDSPHDRWKSLKRFVRGWDAWDTDVAEIDRLSVLPQWDTGPECWRPVVRVAEGKPLVLTRTVACVTDANHLVELVFAHAEGLPTANIELRADDVRLEPVAAIVEREAAPPAEPLGPDQKPAQKKEPTNARRRSEPAGANTSRQEAGPFVVTTVRWDLSASKQRAAQLALTISFDKHPSGLRWHGLTLKSGTNTLPAHTQPEPLGHD